MKFSGAMQADKIHVDRLNKTIHLDLGLEEVCQCDGIDMAVDTPPTSITVNSEIATSDSQPVTISFESKTVRCDWGDIRETHGEPIFKGGTVDVHFTWNAVGNWSGGTDASPNLLKLEFTGDSNYQVYSEAESPPWWGGWTGNTGGLPDFFKDIRAPKPNVDLNMHALDYFLTTNVFFPGKQIFKADTPIADSNKTTGLAFPRDLILTGNIVTE